MIKSTWKERRNFVDETFPNLSKRRSRLLARAVSRHLEKEKPGITKMFLEWRINKNGLRHDTDGSSR